MKEPIIQSLLDTDVYKFTMMQVVLHHFPGARARYHFQCRSAGNDFGPCRQRIHEEIEALCALRLAEPELEYLGQLGYFRPDFIEFLRLFQFNSRFIRMNDQGPDLELVVEGPWLHTILFEVPLLAIISEVYSRVQGPKPDLAEGRRRLEAKIKQVTDHPDHASFRFADFGTRRRHSRNWQREVLSRFQETLPDQLIGTSNVFLAKELGVPPVGTQAHEYLQACQALGPRLVDSQKFALDIWAREYRGRLSIALTDVIGMDAFLRDFDLYFAKLYDGMRQDSGDPYEWADKAIEHYRQLGIDPRSRKLVFSDSLTMEKALAIHQYVHTQAQPLFGIGTHLTNDLGHTPPDIVIKMTGCNDQPVAKITDSPGKITSKDDDYLRYLAQVFEVKHRLSE